MYLENYGERLILVKGNAYPFKDELKSLGGKWNPDQKAWSFQKSMKDELDQFIEENGGESKKAPAKKNTFISNNNNKDLITKKEFLALLTRVERLEQLMGHSLGTNNKKLDVPKVFEINKQKVDEKVEKKVVEKKKEESEDEESEEEEKIEKPRRLLHKKKS